MKFNYGLEKKRFDETWERLENEYRVAGMSEEAIEKMKAYDWDQFKKERIYCMHNQFYQGQAFVNGDDIEDGKDPLLEKYFDSFTEVDVYFSERKHGWVELLDDENLVIAIKSMNAEHVELITNYVYEEMTHRQIAQNLGITRPAVTIKFREIRKNIKKFKK